MPIRPLASLCIMLALAGCAAVAVPAAAPPPVAASGPAFIERSLADGDVILAAQPAAGDFAALRVAGVTRVINLRGADEMAALGFDEPASAAAAGMRYVHAPLSGNAGYTPAALAAFAREMALDDGGKLLLHCGSGTRAGLLYAAWLVQYRGQTPDAAMRTVAPLGLWPLPMERLLGRGLSLQFADEVGSDSFEKGSD